MHNVSSEHSFEAGKFEMLSRTKAELNLPDTCKKIYNLN